MESTAVSARPLHRKEKEETFLEVQWKDRGVTLAEADDWQEIVDLLLTHPVSMSLLENQPVRGSHILPEMAGSGGDTVAAHRARVFL